jgi:DNA replication and repair protein RecF
MLESFSTTGFRNLGSAPFSFAPGVTLFSGENGAGKTNILEAIAVVAGRPSFRNAESRDMAREGSFFVRASVRRESGAEQVAVHWSAGQPRRFSRNGERATFAEAGEALPAVFLAPEDRALFLGTPAVRRKFLDRLSITLYPAAAETYDRFRRALAQRNALLASPSPDAGALEAWTEEFIRCAQAVAARREEARELWSERFAARLASAGALSDLRAEPKAAPPEAYAERARALASRERERGHTLFGPQRDDLEFTRGGKAFGSSASTGEIMRAAFLVRLSEGETVARARGVAPFYALDDFDAELSPGAAESLLGALPEDAQVALTSAHPDAAERCPRRPEAVFEVVEGCARPKMLGTTRENMRRIG